MATKLKLVNVEWWMEFLSFVISASPMVRFEFSKVALYFFRYRNFGNFCEGFIFRETAHMRYAKVREN